MEEQDEELQKFEIICRKCKQRSVNSHTNMFFHWEKKYYHISCLNHGCGQEEIFDEYGKRIDLDDVVKAELKEKEKDKKLPN